MLKSGIVTLLSAACIMASGMVNAQKSYVVADTASVVAKKSSRLTIGGYGEAVYSFHQYSDNVFRYSHASRYSEARGHGQVDLPHAVIMLGYDFGHGWTMGTEIEFEHGGIEGAVEKETEETGEFELEIERGGEVALEQFWLQKSFCREVNLRMGHIVVPVGMTNNNHTPDQFFTVFRPEGENTIMPCTWHETGVSLWGRVANWRYEVQVIPGLNSNLFNDAGWIHNGSASPYEFRPSSHLAGAARIDFTGVKGLRLSVSGYMGNSFNNDITTTEYSETSPYYDAKGTVMIGAFDFKYANRYAVVRGNADFGHLNDAALVSQHNKNQTTMSGNPYPHTTVGQEAWAAGIEAGLNVLAFFNRPQRLFVFGHYEHYDSFVPAEGQLDIGWANRQVVSVGLNYCPISEIAIKAEVGSRLFDEQYNSEPFFAIGTTWTGFFKR
ncbi:MAG: hypothetical protein IJ761_05570 [Bacteroidales bacterium]|nr:hypothetical protein [Bacteroidales bacterium]